MLPQNLSKSETLRTKEIEKQEMHNSLLQLLDHNRIEMSVQKLQQKCQKQRNNQNKNATMRKF